MSQLKQSSNENLDKKENPMYVERGKGVKNICEIWRLRNG